MPNSLRENKMSTAQVAEARVLHEDLVMRHRRAPNDFDSGMRALEPLYGLAYWSQHDLRYKRRAVRDGKQHPTQKPIEVMERCILELPKKAKSILDPFMGSGTTGVACAKLGRKFIGIELEERYFDIACQRIQKAYDQPDLFIAPPEPKPKQEALL